MLEACVLVALGPAKLEVANKHGGLLVGGGDLEEGSRKNRERSEDHVAPICNLSSMPLSPGFQ